MKKNLELRAKKSKILYNLALSKQFFIKEDIEKLFIEAKLNYHQTQIPFLLSLCEIDYKVEFDSHFDTNLNTKVYYLKDKNA